MSTIREQLIELFYDNNVHCDQTIEHLVDDVIDITKDSDTVLLNTVKSVDAAEYIERDEAVRKALDACIKVVGHGITQIDAVDIAEIMDSIPTADVVGVRYGEWIELVRDIGKGRTITKYQCSLCGVYLAAEANYCPNCGTKMNRKEVI